MKKRITRNRRYTDKMTWNRKLQDGLSKRDFVVCEKLMLFANEETKN